MLKEPSFQKGISEVLYFEQIYDIDFLYPFEHRYMAAMEAKKVKEKEVKPAGNAAGGGRGRGGGSKEVSRSQPGGGGHKGAMSLILKTLLLILIKKFYN